MSGYIKYFDYGGKNISFVTDDKEVYEKYNKIWNVVRKLLKLKFNVNPVRDDKYISAKLKIFNKINRTTFTNNVVPIEKNHYICIPAIKKNFMAPFYGWGSTASRLEPLRGGSLLFTTKFPEIPGTHFIDLGRMKG